MQTDKTVFVIHFQALERYPPGINFVNFLGEKVDGRVVVCSLKNPSFYNLPEFNSAGSKLEVYRPGFLQHIGWKRWLNYFWFYFQTLLLLFRFKPSSVVYFETLSSWPALIYKKVRRNKVKLLVHYHEYVSPLQYASNMKLAKVMHKMEQGMYPHSYSWISHTNEVRMAMFRKDNSLENTSDSLFHTMPNYPPQSWKKTSNRKCARSGITRLVFIGSLGYKNMYLKETVEFALKNHNKFTLDLYAYNIDSVALNYLNSLNSDNIKFFGGKSYDELPEVLSSYDVGLVMYKPFSENTVNAVSNKVFEYLACGLDVWFSRDMTYSMKYVDESCRPKVIAIDFNNLDTFDFEAALNKEGLRERRDEYFAEEVFNEILQLLS